MATRATFRDSRPELGAAPSRPDASRLAAARRRRSLPWITVGVLLVVGCGLASAVVVGRAGDRQPVLAAARDLPAGQVLAASDLRVVRVAAGAEVPTVPAASRSGVVGRTVAMPVAAGSLLGPRVLGPTTYPPSGYAVVGAALEPGRYPPGLSDGAWVLVVATPEAGSATGDAAPAAEEVSTRATVVDVQAASTAQQGRTVVSLLVAADAAEQVARAAAAGQVSIVEVAAGR